MYQPLVGFFRGQGLLVLREVATPEGRIDVVAARIDWTAALERLRLGFLDGLTRFALLRAWEAVPRRGTITADALSEALAVSTTSARALAHELADRDFVCRTPCGYERRDSPPTILQELICCEAKLDDWRRGLAQAYGHRFYADRLYLALANRVPGTVDTDLLERRQVGLLSVARAVLLEREAPLRPAPTGLLRQYLEERFWVDAVEPQLRRGTRGFSARASLATA